MWNLPNNQIPTAGDLEEYMLEGCTGSGVTRIVRITEKDYIALSNKERMTLYVVPPDIDYSKKYFTIKTSSGGTMYLPPTTTGYYRTNGGAWTSYSSSAPYAISVANGDSIELKANGLNLISGYNKKNLYSAVPFEVYGNIQSLYHGDDFLSYTTAVNATNLFCGATGLTSAENLILPEVVSSSCYYGMFMYCGSLVKAPKLPATTLASSCYQYMFGFCTSLTEAPELPATTLQSTCYSNMFNSCRALTEAPELLAATVPGYAYQNMFANCTALNYIKCLATDISASNCLLNWTNNVAATGTFVKAVGTTWPTGTSGIPTGWVTEEEGEEVIPFEEQYFTIKVHSTGIFYARASMGTENALYYRINGGEWVGSPISDDPNNEFIPIPIGSANSTIEFKSSGGVLYTLPRPTFSGVSTFEAYGNIQSLFHGDDFSSYTDAHNFTAFSGCITLVSAENLILPDTVSDSCYTSMFRGCSSLTKAPVLPATALTTSCYEKMFMGCTSLSYIKCLAVTGIDTNYSTTNWVSGVGSSGTFVKASSATWPSGVNGIPTGWTTQNA